MTYAFGKRLARERSPGVSKDVTEEAQRVFDALAALEAMEDPIERARAAGQVLRDHKRRAPRLRDLQRAVVLDLRSQKVPYRKIAAQLDISVGAVQDLERGHTGAWGTKPRTKPKPAEPPVAE
jgi:DNA-directed RNA polymerase specialized sigma24 family protein